MTEALLATLLAALVAGLAGSGHCVAMCGGIAGVLGLSSRAAAERSGRPWIYPFAYNGGRVASYALAGALVGAVGSGLAGLALAGRLLVLVQWLSGLLLVVIGLRLVFGARAFAWLDGAGAGVWRRLSPLMRHVLPVSSPARAIGAGMLWGWLPCGMAYSVLMVAWLSASARDGALIMAAFGIGTLPLLVLTGRGASRAAQLGGDPRWRRTGGAFIAALGALSLALPWLVPHGNAEGLVAAIRACLPSLGG